MKLQATGQSTVIILLPVARKRQEQGKNLHNKL